MALTEYLDELSPAICMLVGLAMIIFPEPATSAFGAGLFLFGLAWFFWEWGRP